MWLILWGNIMARKTQLLALVAQVRAETGRTQNVAVGVDELDNIKYLLSRVQEQLYDDYDWPFMNVQRTVALANGQRYYDFPTDLPLDNITDVALNYNDVYQKIERGIQPRDYSVFDSNASTPEKSSPVLKWDVRETGTTEQIEVWPIPNDNIQTLYFWGKKSLANLIQESDTADLDDRLIVLYAAAQMLARQKSLDAQAVLEQANKRLATLRRNTRKASPTIQMGLGGWRNIDRHKVKIVIS